MILLFVISVDQKLGQVWFHIADREDTPASSREDDLKMIKMLFSGQAALRALDGLRRVSDAWLGHGPFK
jgi:hypothetical protein